MPQQPPINNFWISVLAVVGTFFNSVTFAEVAPSIVIHQGEVVLFALPIESGMQSAVGQFQDQAIPFFEDGQRLSALLGADLALAPGKYPLAINKKEYIVEVLPTDFGVETLTLPKDKVDLSPATAERVAKEAAQFQDVFGQRRPSLAGGDKRLWSDLFLVPVEGPTSGTFGKKRVINGQEKNPHTGEDIRAPLGASVAASNSGKIVLSGDFFFNGLSLVIDHGGGLFTMYFHLSEMKVKAGDLVKRGQVIGLVGQSGRATGPHLHWGARLNGARVDPFSLVKAVKGVILANGRP